LRRQRRLAILAAVSLAGMAVTSTLAIVAIEARDAARDQRREAEGLVGFMLGDLRDKLEPLGRLDVLDSVGARALAYFESQDKTRLSDEALAQRSRALTLMGEIANSRGDLNGALRRYQEAFVSTQELLRRSPADPSRLFDHAQNVFWVGQIAWQRGQTGQAERAIREYKRLAEQMIGLDPSNEKYRLERKYANTSLGAVLIDLRRYGEAAAIFRAALNDVEALTAAAPGNPAYQEGRLETLAWLSEALEKEGRLDDALAQRERQLKFLEPLLGSPKSNADYRLQAMIAHMVAGRLLATRSDVSNGTSELRKSIRLGEELMQMEPDNAAWAGFAAGPYFELGELQLTLGQVDEAGKSVRAGCDIVDRLVAQDSTVKQWRADLRDNCLPLRARLALARGANEEARALAGRGVALSRAEARSDSTPDRQQALSRAIFISGMVAAQSGDRGAARRAYEEAFAAFPKGVALVPTWQSRQVILLDAVGRPAEAATKARALEAIGYRHPNYLHERQIIRRS